MSHPHPSREHRIRAAHKALRDEQEAHRRVLADRPDLAGWVFPLSVATMAGVFGLLQGFRTTVMLAAFMVVLMLGHLALLSWRFHRRCRAATAALSRARSFHDDALQRPSWARARHMRVSRRQWSPRQVPPGGRGAGAGGRWHVYQRIMNRRGWEPR